MPSSDRDHRARHPRCRYSRRSLEKLSTEELEDRLVKAIRSRRIGREHLVELVQLYGLCPRDAEFQPGVRVYTGDGDWGPPRQDLVVRHLADPETDAEQIESYGLGVWCEREEWEPSAGEIVFIPFHELNFVDFPPVGGSVRSLDP